MCVKRISLSVRAIVLLKIPNIESQKDYYALIICYLSLFASGVWPKSGIFCSSEYAEAPSMNSASFIAFYNASNFV